MKKVLLLATVASSLFANIDVESIDIFKNKSFVNQNIKTTQNSVDLVGNVRLEDIRFSIPEACRINSTDTKQIDFDSDTLGVQIESLKEKINSNQSKIKSLKSNISFLEKTSLNSLSSSKSLKETSSFIKKEIMNNHKDIYLTQKEINKQNQKLNELNKKRANSKFTRLDYDISCKNSNVLISYPVYNISRNGFYDINYDSKSNDLQIKNSSFITQSSGVDFKNIDINLYTYNFVQQLKPNKFYPKYLDIYPEARAMPMVAEMAMDSSRAVKMAKSNTPRPSFAYVEDTTRSFFKASNINLISGKKTEVLFAKDNYKAKQSLEIDGYSGSSAFYKVDFKSKKLYGILNSKLYLDGTYIGRAHQEEIKKDKESSVFFGTNRFIDIKKELVKDMKEEPFFSMNKLKSQKIWQYKITNNSKKEESISLIERVPVSKHEDIKVKLIGKSKHTKMDKNGKMFYDFKLKPKETKIIEFGYEVEKPNKK